MWISALGAFESADAALRKPIEATVDIRKFNKWKRELMVDRRMGQ